MARTGSDAEHYLDGDILKGIVFAKKERALPLILDGVTTD